MIQILGSIMMAVSLQFAEVKDTPEALKQQAAAVAAQAQEIKSISQGPGFSAAESQLLREQAARLLAQADALQEQAQKAEREAAASKKPAARDYSFLLSQLTGNDLRRALSRIADEKLAQAQHLEHMARQKSRPPEESDQLWIDAAALRREATELRAQGVRAEKEARDARMAANRAQQTAALIKKFGPR